jgi:formate dehydrogenase major subunit
VCWTLGITEHHNAVDNVLAIINLALLTGHVGRWGSGLVPLRGQNNVQGGGDMGAIPNKFVGGQDVENPEDRARFERMYGTKIPPKRGMHLSQMFEAMEHGTLKALYVLGENPVQSEADAHRARRLLEGVDLMIVQDIFLTKTAEIADVVLPAAASWCESEGTVTSSERRVQRVRKALDPPGDARDDIDILCDLARRLRRLGTSNAGGHLEELALSSWHHGMTQERLARSVVCMAVPDENRPGSPFSTGACGKTRGGRRRRSCRLSSHRVDTRRRVSVRLTTGRGSTRSTQGQTGGYRRRCAVANADLHPTTA